METQILLKLTSTTSAVHVAKGSLTKLETVQN